MENTDSARFWKWVCEEEDAWDAATERVQRFLAECLLPAETKDDADSPANQDDVDGD